MANIKLLSTVVVLFTLVSAVTSAQNADSYSHLHNSGKSFTPVSKMSSQDWQNPDELERVWLASLVKVPLGNSKYLETTIQQLGEKDISSLGKFPTIVYLHGCSGIWSGTLRRINFFAENGFVVIAPPSFARKKYAKSCETEEHKSSIYRDVIRIRQADAAHVIAMAKELPFVEKNNIFLVGLSEGGITTATLHAKNASVNARIVEGWTCQTTWREYRGIKAPNSEPVLSLVGSEDPWFIKPWNQGDCGEFLNRRNGSKSVVFKQGELSRKHELLEYQEVQKLVLDFLQKHIL